MDIPDGYEFVHDGKVKEGEYFIATKTREVLQAKQDFDYVVVTVVRPAAARGREGRERGNQPANL